MKKNTENLNILLHCANFKNVAKWYSMAYIYLAWVPNPCGPRSECQAKINNSHSGDHFKDVIRWLWAYLCIA